MTYKDTTNAYNCLGRWCIPCKLYSWENINSIKMTQWLKDISKW